MTNGSNADQVREDEIIDLEQLRDGKMVENIFPKIGRRLRLAHEENEQLSITGRDRQARQGPRDDLAVPDQPLLCCDE